MFSTKPWSVNYSYPLRTDKDPLKAMDSVFGSHNCSYIKTEIKIHSVYVILLNFSFWTLYGKTIKKSNILSLRSTKRILEFLRVCSSTRRRSRHIIEKAAIFPFMSTQLCIPPCSVVISGTPTQRRGILLNVPYR